MPVSALKIDSDLIERSPGLSYAHPIRLTAKLAALAAMVGSADAAPTRQSYEVFGELAQVLERATTRLQTLVERDLATLNADLRRLGMPIIGAP